MIVHDSKMVAPCGMNCTYCYAHHKKKKQCMGCRTISENMPTACRKCEIKECVTSKQLEYCNECSDYPCTRIKNLEKSYNKRYNESLMNNLDVIKHDGMASYLNAEKLRLKCKSCDGYLNIHDKICSNCGKTPQ